jgi:hypothetical protein
MKWIYCILSLLTPFLVEPSELAVSTEIAASATLSGATRQGFHDCSTNQTSWAHAASFVVDSNSASGFTITAEWQGDFGWALNGTGNTQGVDFNAFTEAKLDSADSMHYVGANSMGFILPVTWSSGQSSQTRAITNGEQDAVMSGWIVDLHLKWNSAPTLSSGIYSQILTVTVTTN